MKKQAYLFLPVFTIIFLFGCQKDTTSVLTTDAPGTPNTVNIPVPPPPTDQNDSSMLMGNPSEATAVATNANNYLLREGYYSVSYNNQLGRPNWVSWHVVPTDYGSQTRLDNFRPNPNLPNTFYAVTPLSYTSSGFDKGHMCPSADRTSSYDANSSTFLMTNIVPQALNNNQQRWARLEDECRSLVQTKNELYIISGVYGEGGTGSNGLATTIDNGKVTVPSHLWKVIVVLPFGKDDLNRVTNSTRVISVLMPNENSAETDWRLFRTSVDEIERQTGHNLLSQVPSAIQTIIEAKTDSL